MAFTYGYSKDQSGDGAPIGGGMILRCGWYKSAGASTGGDIITGFKTLYILLLQPHANAAWALAPVVNENLTALSVPFTGTATIVTNANEVGRWLGLGN